MGDVINFEPQRKRAKDEAPGDTPFLERLREYKTPLILALIALMALSVVI